MIKFKRNILDKSGDENYNKNIKYQIVEPSFTI